MYPTNTDTVDKAIASEDTEHARTAGHIANDHTPTFIQSNSARDSGNEADMEDIATFDGDSDDEDLCRDIVLQNAVSENDCTLKLSGWQLGDMLRKSNTIPISGKRGRDSDEDDGECWSGMWGEQRARKRRRAEY